MQTAACCRSETAQRACCSDGQLGPSTSGPDTHRLFALTSCLYAPGARASFKGPGPDRDSPPLVATPWQTQDCRHPPVLLGGAVGFPPAASRSCEWLSFPDSPHHPRSALELQHTQPCCRHCTQRSARPHSAPGLPSSGLPSSGRGVALAASAGRHGRSEPPRLSQPSTAPQ